MKITKSFQHIDNFSCDQNPGFGEVQVPILLWAEVSKGNPAPEDVKMTNLDDFPLFIYEFFTRIITGKYY